jgi:hypothetical protein
MRWDCPHCKRSFGTFALAKTHAKIFNHQIFTVDDAGDTFDILLPPTASSVNASLWNRLQYRLDALVS